MTDGSYLRIVAVLRLVVEHVKPRLGARSSANRGASGAEQVPCSDEGGHELRIAWKTKEE